ncbi:hypothetical protein FSP39_001889 [Pinctada imbricata]|uniref:C2H2-type domain-containing protein n=1 Tax=Pinctada imbricata TaxID=66713 RepID=A0AA88YUJ7_PINIB|nr:hypothetical protein FSP39_001889 [Pinctada imbricata]
MEKYITDENIHVTLRELKDNITNYRIYLKTDYKLHLSLSDRCADHCISYALSDSSQRGYLKACEDHEHDQICERCDLLPQSLLQLKEMVGSLDLPEDISEDFLASIDVAESKIQNWKSHIMRSANQDLARSLLLSGMDYGEALIIMDWAMKFLPIAYREKQSDWYGQKGVNWHVCVCIYKDEDGILKQRTYAHIMDSAKQDWIAVATLIQHILSIIQTQIPGIKQVYLRSGNAGCYHCGNLWLAIPEISQRTGIHIARYDFSEAQNGKSYCDSKIAHMRSQIMKVAASGSDVLNVADMKMAIYQNGGIKACQSAHVEILSSSSSSGSKIRQISKISNIQFHSDGSITVWRAYEIGSGVTISLQSQDGHFENQFEVYQNFALPDIPDSHITSPTYRCEMDEKFSLSCPENGCICTFDSYVQMQNHCLIANHEFSSSSSTFDRIKLRWKDTCFNMSTGVHKVKFESGMKSGSSMSEIGWALKKDKKNARFSEKSKGLPPRLACLKRSGKLQGVVEDHDLEAIIHAINTEEAKAQLV